MKQYYKEESDYCFTKFMEYAEILGYLDRDTTKSNIENIFDEKQEELDDDDSGDIGLEITLNDSRRINSNRCIST